MALTFGAETARGILFKSFGRVNLVPSPIVEPVLRIEKPEVALLPPGPMPIALLTAVAGQTEPIFLLPARV
ncbi:MAG: hypothetical protein ABI758_01285 [Candidatus Woesebacteria bacterium]